MREGELIVPFVADFADLARSSGARTAVVHGDGEEIGFAELHELTESTGRWLASRHGVGPGSRVVAVLPNSVAAAVAMLGCFRIGAEFAPLPCHSTPHELVAYCKLLQPAVVLLHSSVSAGLAQAVEDAGYAVEMLSPGAEHERFASGGEAELPEPQTPGRLLIATSGSTGAPKVIVLDADRLWSSGKAFAKLHGLDLVSPRFWNFLPMSYLGGLFNLFLIPIAAGGSAYIGEAFSGRTILGFWNTVRRFDIDALWLVPTILRGLLEMGHRIDRRQGPDQIKTCMLGTAPVSVAEKQQFEAMFGITPLESYGLSETTFITSEFRDSLLSRAEGSVGRVLPYVDVKLVAPAASLEDSAGAALEIAAKSPFLMLGYLREDGGLDLPLDKEGYFLTGDLAEERNGVLLLRGRNRDIIKKGGLLVYLREIELTAEGHEGVAEAAAVPVSHKFYGESFNLYVKGTAANLDPLALNSWLEERLVKHKIPEQIIIVPDLPKTSSGKVQKHLLQTA